MSGSEGSPILAADDPSTATMGNGIENALDPALEALERAMYNQEQDGGPSFGDYDRHVATLEDSQRNVAVGVKPTGVMRVDAEGDAPLTRLTPGGAGLTGEDLEHAQDDHPSPFRHQPSNAEASTSALTLDHPPPSAVPAPLAAEPTSDQSAPATQKRGRGRPKGSKNKPKDKNDPAYKPTRGELRERAKYDENGNRIWKKRGRPPKRPPELGESSAPAPGPSNTKRRKADMDVRLPNTTEGSPAAAEPPPVPAKRGRPRKNPEILVRDIRPRPRRKSELARRKDRPQSLATQPSGRTFDGGGAIDTGDGSYGEYPASDDVPSISGRSIQFHEGQSAPETERIHQADPASTIEHALLSGHEAYQSDLQQQQSHMLQAELLQHMHLPQGSDGGPQYHIDARALEVLLSGAGDIPDVPQHGDTLGP